MKVLVTGGRDFNLPSAVDQELTALQPTMSVVGDARGADYLARQWAVVHGVRHVVYAAEWQVHGKAAGPIRNGKMLTEKPDLVLAFPGGRGTADMVRQARAAGVAVREVKPTWSGSSDPRRKAGES